jgi:hypothetical protein
MPPPKDDASRVHTLLTFYRASHYEAVLPDGRTLRLRVGERPPPVLFEWMGEDDLSAYLTACNPHSRALTAAQNAQRMAVLLQELEAGNIPYLRGEGFLPGETWREPSVLVKGLSLGDIDALVRRHSQNSILLMRHGEAASLRVYRDDWRGLLPPAPDLQWA